MFEVDGSRLGFENLKQKYLELKQVSLNSKRKSELMEAHGRPTPHKDFVEQDEHFFKVEKQMMEHLNRLQPKEFLRTRVNGYKTIFHPAYKATQ